MCEHWDGLMRKILSTSILTAMLGGIALSPAHAKRDAYERESWRETQRSQHPIAMPAPGAPLVEGRNVYIAPPATGAVEPYIERAERNDRRSR